MTIGKKLYLGFSAVLAVMFILSLINLATVMREYHARDTVRTTQQDVRAIGDVRSAIMANRLSLGSYLLSGDLREEDKTSKGIRTLQNLLKRSELNTPDVL